MESNPFQICNFCTNHRLGFTFLKAIKGSLFHEITKLEMSLENISVICFDFLFSKLYYLKVMKFHLDSSVTIALTAMTNRQGLVFAQLMNAIYKEKLETILLWLYTKDI